MEQADRKTDKISFVYLLERVDSYNSIRKRIKIIPRTLNTNDFATTSKCRGAKSDLVHNYANLCIVMHATDPIFFSYLRLIITKAHINFSLI